MSATQEIMVRAMNNYDIVAGAAVIGFLVGRTMMKRKMRQNSLGMGGL